MAQPSAPPLMRWRPRGGCRWSERRADRPHTAARQSASSSSSSCSGMCGCHSPRIGWITAPGSSSPQSTRSVQRKWRPVIPCVRLPRSGAVKPTPEAEIAKAVQLLDLVLEHFADDGHWTRGRYDDGNGGHCLVGALLHLSRKHRLPRAPAIALLQDALPRPGLPLGTSTTPVAAASPN
jgi:hypothetical protein